MKKVTVVFMLMVVYHSTFSQEKLITTFILVRHAEKDMTQSTDDPDLSAEGKTRALKLTEVLMQTEIQAVYSTDFKRTRQTVEPLASLRSLNVNLYDSRNDQDIDRMLQQHAGNTLLVSGHSNTIPNFVNYLVGEVRYKPFEDNEYGNIIIVSVTERGKNAKVVWLNY